MRTRVHTPPRASLPPGTAGGASGTGIRDPWSWVLAAGVLATYGVVLFHGLRDHWYILDSVNATIVGRDVAAGLPASLFDDALGRGPERITVWVAALSNMLATTAEGELRLGHAIHSAFYVATAFPAFGLARFVGVTKPLAVLAGLLAIAGPAAVLGTTLLNTSAGYFSSTLLALTMCRTLAAPSTRRDAAFLGAVVLVSLARVGFAPLALAMAPALLLVELRSVDGASSLGDRMRGLPRRIWSSHPLLVAIGAGAALVVIAKGPVWAASYGAGRVAQYRALDPGTIWMQVWQTTARVAMVSGPLLLVCALAFLFAELFRPRTRERWIFALVSSLLAVLLMYIAYLGFNEDRYVSTMFALVAVAAVTTFARPAKGSSWLVAASGLAVAATLAWYPIELQRGANAVVLPGAALYANPIADAITGVLGGVNAIEIVAAIVGATALTVALATRAGGAGRIVLYTVLGVSVGIQVFGATWTTARWDKADMRTDFDLRSLAVVDATGRPSERAPLLLTAAPSPAAALAFPQLQKFNRTELPVSTFRRGAQPFERGPGISERVHVIEVDEATGLLSDWPRSDTKFVLDDGFHAGIPVVSRAYPIGVFTVIEASSPVRLQYLVTGQGRGGVLTTGVAATVRVYPQDADDRCVRIGLLADAGPLKWRIAGEHGTLSRGKGHAVVERLSGRRQDFEVVARSRTGADLAGRIADVRVAGCDTLRSSGPG